jgi:hypothetical protein
MRARTGFLVVLLVGAIAITALAAGKANRVVGNCTKSLLRPATIVLACADDNLALTHLHWSAFGGTQAIGTGDYYVNGCVPDCAGGKFHSYPVEVVLTAARPCPDGHDDYRQASLTFRSTRPRGARSKVELFCPLPG